MLNKRFFTNLVLALAIGVIGGYFLGLKLIQFERSIYTTYKPAANTLATLPPTQKPAPQLIEMHSILAHHNIHIDTNTLLFLYITLVDIKDKIHSSQDYKQEIIDLQLMGKGNPVIQNMVTALSNLTPMTSLLSQYELIKSKLSDEEYFGGDDISYLGKISLLISHQIGIRKKDDSKMPKTLLLQEYLMKKRYDLALETLASFHFTNKDIANLTENIKAHIIAEKSLTSAHQELKLLIARQMNVKRND